MNSSPIDIAARGAVLGAALFLAACAGGPFRGGSDTAPVRASAPNVNLSGYNTAFKEGYADGCNSARQSMRRDAKRYEADTDYMMGWNDGKAMCGRR